MATPGPGLSLIPVDGPTRTALAQQLHCWAQQANGMTDPRIRFYSCCKLGYYYIPPEVCDAGYGDIPFTSRGTVIVCDPAEDNQFDLTILPSDVAPLNVDTCTGEGIQLTTPAGVTAGTATATSVPISFDEVPGADGYVVRWRTGTGAWTETAVSATSPITVTGLTASTLYEFQVQARDSTVGGYTASMWSASVSATTAAA